MNRTEKNMLVQFIRDNDISSGTVVKANGQWYVEGKKSKVPPPVIKMPHWTAGTKQVVIEQPKD